MLAAVRAWASWLVSGVLGACGGPAPAVAPAVVSEVAGSGAVVAGGRAENDVRGAVRPEIAVVPGWRGVAEVVVAPTGPWPPGVRWIAAGGGGTPEFNQVSIEQDLGLARESFGADGLLLFAGGRGSHGVQVQAAARGDTLLAELGDLFAPRGGRAASYRPTMLAPAGAATAANVRAAIEAATVDAGAGPLLVYLAGHGQRGEALADATIELWGQEALAASELAGLLDGRPRPVRVVVTSCFSGGFAELAFAAADAERRRPAAGRCGLFAATAEREASGCDPNPDRAAQEGYGLHFLQALQGRDREGKVAAIDLDGDGRVSLLEAHTRARIASTGIDVPTSTSERWLRATPGLRGRAAESAAATELLREESIVIAALAEQLGLVGREGEAAGLLRAVEEDMAEVTGRIDQASADEDAAYRRTAAELLARWPVLDDAWHPEFVAMLTAEREAIAAALASSAGYREYKAARAVVEAAQAEQAALLARGARLERLVRAVETRTLAQLSARRGGADWDEYVALVECERWVPGG